MTVSQSILVWFRNDLRIHDNETLFKASQQNSNIIPVFIFDPRWFRMLDLGFKKTEIRRTKFLIEAVQNLRENLSKIGSNLIVRIGKPEEILPQLAQQYNASAIYASKEVTQEETDVEKRLEAGGLKIHYFWQATLYHLDDLPFSIQQLPDVFTAFRNKIEKFVKIRNSYPIPKTLVLDAAIDIGKIPTLTDLGFSQTLSQNPKAVMVFEGGETAGLAHLHDYFWQKDLLKTYKQTRNELLGADYSSKFSVWLANGCLSPRYIYEEIKRYERERTANDSTYWLIFELIWRDYFRFVTLKYGNCIFFTEGIKNDLQTDWKHDAKRFDLWKNGETGIPFIDANMIELAETGFMSNRGRQNVASFLAKDLKIDWTWGAVWFESQLLDYDVCSNWGNWIYVAGVGNDPRENRYFNILTQATRYDEKGYYVKHWLPQLSDVPADRIHVVSLLASNEQSQYGVRIGVNYPNAVLNVAKWLKKS